MTTNRFDFLRLVFAGWVGMYHLIVLPRLDPTGGWEYGAALGADIAIQGFFVISGALVLGSLERSRSLSHYASKRIRRVFPAYAVIILIPACVSFGLSTEMKGVGAYVLANLAYLNFLAPELPGLFDTHRFSAVNGALWTLKIEIMFYAVLPVLAWGVGQCHKRGPYGRVIAIVLLMILGIVWKLVTLYMIPPEHVLGPYRAQLARQLPGQLPYFACGMALWYVWNTIQSPKLWYLIAGIALIGASFLAPFGDLFRAPGLALCIAWAAFSRGPVLDAAKYGDLSYGIYITHFPIIQALISLGVFALSVWLGVGLAIILTLIASAILWHGVEKRFLSRRAHIQPVSQIRQDAPRTSNDNPR